MRHNISSPSGDRITRHETAIMILIVFAAFAAGYRGFRHIRKKQRCSLDPDVKSPGYRKFQDMDELIDDRFAASIDAGWSDTLALHP